MITKKTMVLMVLAVMLPLATLGAVYKATPTRYVSEWTQVPPGGVYVFWHGIGTRPLILNVWIAHFVAGEDIDAEFNEAYPHTQSGLLIQTVNQEFISVLNTEDVALFVQVLAEK